MIKDGWHIICGNQMYVEDGFVRFGTVGEGVRYRTLHVYRLFKGVGWLHTPTLTVDAFRAAYKRGIIKLA